MKPMQPMSLSMPLVKRYDDPESGCESYMHAALGELPNSILLTMSKPLETLRPPAPSTTQSPGLAAAVKLSSTLYLDVGAVRHNLLRGGNSTLGMSSVQSTSSGMNRDAGSGGDSNSDDLSTGGGKYNDDGRGGSGGEGCSG
uniref:Uncharacterized protein n=1 Tax=Tanacetum cinerariifolium TaxID=118510 RepID=A0A699JQG5_TANCI|nr:hypothetical protein [Tanacetum cinerariifolium]